MDDRELNALIEKVARELQQQGLIASSQAEKPAAQQPASSAPLFLSMQTGGDLSIDLPDPAAENLRRKPGIDKPADAEGLGALMSVTTARIGAGRAGARYRTGSLLLFQADLAVTHDTLFRDVDPGLLAAHRLFEVQSAVSQGKQEYLLRPDLGRKLNEDARRVIKEKCVPSPNIQVVVGDGLSASAIEANLAKIFPVLEAGSKSAGLTFGTPIYIKYCRVGVMNDIGDLIKPDVLILLIGERPGLGRAESMSAYMAYRPKAGDTDAERDVICNIFDGGGTNPLEAGAYALQLAKKMIARQASGVKFKQMDEN